jgi:hypothetical protein
MTDDGLWRFRRWSQRLFLTIFFVDFCLKFGTIPTAIEMAGI